MRTLNLGLVALLLGPIATAVDQDPLPRVQLSVEFPAQDRRFDNPSGLTLRTTASQPVKLRIELSVDDRSDSSGQIGDLADLIEIRDLEGGWATRFDDLERVAAGAYETTHRFPDAGEFVIVVLPDVEDRSRLTPERTDMVRLVVEPVPSPTSVGRGGLPLVLATVALVLVGALVFKATKRRTRSERVPMTHDSWWNPP